MDRLPTTKDGVDGLLSMADDFGAAELFRFLRMVRAVGRVRTSHAAAEAMSLLAARIAGTRDQSFVALELGYPPNSRGNFYKLVAEGKHIDEPVALPLGDRLPTAADGLPGLLGMAERYGDVELFKFLRMVRLPHPGGRGQATIATRATAILAAWIVNAQVQEHPDVDYVTNRRNAAIELGFSPKTWTNFYDFVTAGEKLLGQTR